MEEKTEFVRVPARKWEKLKNYKKQHPADSTCLIISLVGVAAFLIVFFIVFYVWPPRYVIPPPPLDKTFPVPPAPLERFGRRRITCTTGETFDNEIQMCVPNFYSPLAFDAAIMDVREPSCRSFYRNMCGTWIDQHFNENRAFSFGHHKTQARLKNLISTKSTPINAFYKSCLDTSVKENRIEYKHMLEVIVGDLRSHADLPVIFGRLAQYGYTAPFSLSIERHPLENRTIPMIIPDAFPETLDEGQIYLILNNAREITKSNSVEINHKLIAILKILKALRQNIAYTPADVEDYRTYLTTKFKQQDLVSFDEIPQMWNARGYGSIRGWTLYFQALGGQALRFEPKQDIWAFGNGKAYLEWFLSSGLASFEVTEWQAYLEFSVLYHGNQFEPELPNNVYFRQHEITGPVNKEQRQRSRIPRASPNRPLTNEEKQTKCLKITQSMVPGLVAREFLDAYFPPEEKRDTKNQIFEMVRLIMAAFKEKIMTSTPWLSDKKILLKEKLEHTLVRVIEPDEIWLPEPFAEQLGADRYDHNMNLVRRYRVERNLDLWHKDNPNSFDQSALAYFAMPLTETNAYYSGPTNSITILAGILQPPFFSLKYNDISKYAILGSILGHEIAHMMDNSGLYWDKYGSFVPDGLLPAADMQEFYKASACVVREYGPAPAGCEDANVAYGNFTLGEDLADLTGITLAYHAFFDGFKQGSGTTSDKQLFFMILAQAFCEHYDQAHLCESVRSDVHAIAEFRIDRTYRNMPEFHRAFGCGPGTLMYKEENETCRVY
jgi:predicted metalloendopeptidase